jgi:hypothetical protein
MEQQIAALEQHLGVKLRREPGAIEESASEAGTMQSPEVAGAGSGALGLGDVESPTSADDGHHLGDAENFAAHGEEQEPHGDWVDFESSKE